MPRHRADKRAFLIAMTAIFALSIGACNDNKTTSSDLAKSHPEPVAAAAKSGEPVEPLYFGEDWATAPNNPLVAMADKKSDTKPDGKSGSKSSGKSGAAKSDKSGKGGASESKTPSEPTSTWSLVLGTFTGKDHVQAANQMIAEMPKVAPQLRGARVHTTGNGSMVVYGNYKGDDDPAATADREMIKALKSQGYQVFSRVPLTRIDLRMEAGKLNPLDLLSARKKNPKVDPLYTLDVALWMPVEDREASAKERLSYEDSKKKAEEYAKQLRTQGFEAYFYHNDVKRLSTVSVGLFDQRAINQRSGLYSSEVMDVAKKFPARLVNGEPIQELKARFLPQLGAQPQRPVLVIVPMK